MEYKYADLTKELMNAAMEVHSISGNGFQEVIYQRAYEIELNQRNRFIVRREVEMSVQYKEHLVGTRRVDFLINNLVAIGLKALIKLEDVHLAQALNYLKANNLEVS